MKKTRFLLLIIIMISAVLCAVDYPVDMIIITNTTLQSKFQDFAKLKNKEGVKTIVVTTATIGGSSPEIIRNYLTAQKTANPSLKFVLIGGDATVVQPYMIHSPNDYVTWDQYPDSWGWKFPTDFYFSNVLSTWTTNYHELNFNQDIYVGRIPANTTTEVQNFITKYQNYRYNTDSNYTKKYRFISNNYDRHPNYWIADTLMYRLTKKLKTPVKDITYSNQITAPTAVSIGNMLNDATYSFLFTNTHGDTGDQLACTNINTVYPPNLNNPDLTYMNLTNNYNYILNGNGGYPASVYSYLPNYLTNTQSKPYVVWIGACSLSRFYKMSLTDPNIYESHECMAAEFINNNDGAVAIYSSSHYSYPSESFNDSGTLFTNLETNPEKKIGELLSLCYIPRIHWFAAPIQVARRNAFFSHILFGDPSMNLWFKNAASFTISKNNYVPAANLTITVNSGMKAIADATVCVLNSDDTILLRGQTSANGQVSFLTRTDLSAKKISVYKDNFIPSCTNLSAIPVLRNPDQEEEVQNEKLPVISVTVKNPGHILFSISNPKKGRNQIDIFNIKGQKVKSIREMDSSITWNGRNDNNRPISSGIYFYKFTSDTYVKTGKILLVK